MPHIIRHTFVCDICGFEYPEINVRRGESIDRQPLNYERVNGKDICYKHKILVEHNGDMVTVKEAQT